MLEPSDIEVRRHPPCLASCGAPFVIAEVRDRAALRRAQRRMDVFLSHLPRDEMTGRGPTRSPNNDIELSSTCALFSLLLFRRGIFWGDGFWPIISCQRPPRPLKGLGAFFARRLGTSQHSLSLDKVRGHGAGLSNRIQPQTVAEKGPGPLGLVGGACMAA